jgi:hypothetical protein
MVYGAGGNQKPCNAELDQRVLKGGESAALVSVSPFCDAVTS